MITAAATRSLTWVTLLSWTTLLSERANSFTIVPALTTRCGITQQDVFASSTSALYAESAAEKEEQIVSDLNQIQFASDEEKKQAVGNLVEDDEWMGLGMELSEVIRVAVVEDLKKNAREFLGKDEYKIGDITKEIDDRVKGQSTYKHNISLFL